MSKSSAPTAPTGVQPVDPVVAGLDSVYAPIAAAMSAIDRHPGLALLRGGGLRGTTAARWEALRPELELLSTMFAALGDMLEGAHRRHTDDPAAALDELLDAVPEREAVGSIRDQAHQLARRLKTVINVLTKLDTAMRRLSARLAQLIESAEALMPPSASLNLPRLGGAVRDKVSWAAHELLSDPLSAVTRTRLTPTVLARLDELRAEVDAAAGRINELMGVRDGLPLRAATLVALIDDAQAAERRVASAYAVANAWIANAGLPPAPTAAAGLRTALERSLQVGQGGRWAELADALDEVERAIRRAHSRADEMNQLAEGLLARKADLRDRLDAFGERAATLDLGGDQRLIDLYDTADGLLTTSPCDLNAASKAVADYQRAVSKIRPTAPSEPS